MDEKIEILLKQAEAEGIKREDMMATLSKMAEGKKQGLSDEELLNVSGGGLGNFIKNHKAAVITVASLLGAAALAGGGYGVYKLGRHKALTEDFDDANNPAVSEDDYYRKYKSYIDDASKKYAPKPPSKQ